MAVASSSAITASTAAAAVRAAGFPTAMVPVMVAIAMAESSLRPTATHTNSNGSTDYGLFQINSIHTDVLGMGSWSDPYVNAKMAKVIYDRQGLAAWSVYNSGAYNQYLSLAESGSSGGNGSSVSSTGTPISLLPIIAGAASGNGTTQSTPITASNNLPDAAGVPWFLKNETVRRIVLWLLAILLIIAGMIIVFRSQVKTVAVKGISAGIDVASGGTTKVAKTVGKAATKTAASSAAKTLGKGTGNA